MQDYKSLCVAVISCATLVNTQTDIRRERDGFWPAVLLAQPDELKINRCKSL